jgi:hypothetical protein
MTRAMKSSRVQRASSAFSCAHRSPTRGAAGATVVAGARASGAAGTVEGWASAGAAGRDASEATTGGCDGSECARADFRAGLGGNGLISTGDADAAGGWRCGGSGATPLIEAVVPLSAATPAARVSSGDGAGAAARGRDRCGVASGGNDDITLSPGS